MQIITKKKKEKEKLLSTHNAQAQRLVEDNILSIPRPNPYNNNFNVSKEKPF